MNRQQLQDHVNAILRQHDHDRRLRQLATDIDQYNRDALTAYHLTRAIKELETGTP